jgi:hypothetical protein
MTLLNKLFGKPEEINGANRCPTYLYRWHVLSTRRFKAYLHHFVSDDWSLDLHDHPKRFISVGLWGWYYEDTPCPDGWNGCLHTRRYNAPWIRSFPAEHIHRLRVPSRSCWTLVFVLRTVRPWGFWHGGKYIGWREYVGGEIADQMKACGD